MGSGTLFAVAILVIALLLCGRIHAFVGHADGGRVPFLVARQQQPRTASDAGTTTKTTRHQMVIDPVMMVDAGIAVVSAAAGAASQFPRIQELERQLKTARESLTASELELVAKITELEDKLFQMDQEYEQATTKFKKQYDLRMKDDLEKITEKMKVDFQYKLEIRLEEQKSKMLQDKLGLVNGLTGGRQEELVDLRIRNSRVQKANEELEQALEASRVELEKLQGGASQKKGWWPF